MRATDTRTAGVRHLFATYELGEDKLYGHIKSRKTRARFLEFCRYLRSLYPPTQDRHHLRQLQPAPEHGQRQQGRDLAECEQRRDHLYADQFVLVNRIEAQFTALRYFALGTDHASHKEQASMIRRYIIWRNNHAYDERLRRIVDRASAA
jgi:hypothetical protein